MDNHRLFCATFELFAATDLHKQASFSLVLAWEMDRFGSHSARIFYELGYGLRRFEYVRRTINPPIRMAGSIPGGLKAVGECLEIVSKVNKPNAPGEMHCSRNTNC